MKKMMNVKNFQLPQSKNSSNEKNCIKSIDINIPELPLTPKKPKTNNKFQNSSYSTNKPSSKNINIFKLVSMHDNSIKNCIFYEKNLDLLENKLKTLDEEKRKIINKIHNIQNVQKIKEENKENYNKKRNFLSNLIQIKEKEIKDKKDKVKKLKSQEKIRANNIIKYRKENSENLSERKRILKRKILQDISEEKNKINEEKKRNLNLIKILDNDILKRKKGTEKIKNLIKKEKLEKEIKIQEDFNKKLAIKIYEYKKIGLEKINFLQKIKLKLENKF